MRPTDDTRRHWSGGPRCPTCGRAVHRLPDGRLLTPSPAPGGEWTLVDHRCLPRGARHGAPAIVEGPPRGLAAWVIGE